MYHQNKYGDMLNQVTKIDIVSRQFTSNSMYSMTSKKVPFHNEETIIQYNLMVLLSEYKYKHF